jgi:hypothetical protein
MEGREPTHEFTQILVNTLQSINFATLTSHATALRQNIERTDSQCLCTIDPKIFEAGWFNIALEVVFEDGVIWVARLRLPPLQRHQHLHEEQQGASAMAHEIYVMNYVREHTTIPVPEVYGYNLEMDNQVGFRYIFLQALPGRSPQESLPQSVPDQYKHKVYSQFADYKIQLSRLRLPRIGSPLPIENTAGGQGSSAADFFINKYTAEYMKVTRTCDDTDDWFIYWLRLQAVPAMLEPTFNYGPFPLHHEDLGFTNVLLDDEYNISGIIDWSGARSVPIEVFCILSREFRLHPPSHDILIRALRNHEERFDASAPMTAYMESEAAVLTSLVEWGQAPVTKEGRHLYAYPIIKYLYGQEAKLAEVKALYMNSLMYRKAIQNSRLDTS